MATPVLQLTAQMLKSKLNPTDELGLFDYGDGTVITEALVDEILLQQEDVVLSALPEKYRRLCREIEGELLVKDATSGQTTAQLSLYPVTSGTLRLWLDYPGRYYAQIEDERGNSSGKKPYSARKLADCMTETTDYTVNLTTGLLTFTTALAAGQTVHADYQHTGMSRCYVLKFVALTMAALETVRQFPFEISAERLELYRGWEQSANQALAGLWGGDGQFRGIDLLDRVPLEEETRSASRTQRAPILGAW